MEIPKELFRTATLHRSLTDDPINGILSCGFLIKPTDRFSHEELIFPYYGGLLLLSGSGTYSDPSGKRVPLTPGCFVQRMPGKPHTTEVVPDGNWLEFFVCFGKDFYEAMADQHLLSREPVLFHPLTEAMVENCRFLLERFRSTPDFQLFSLLLAGPGICRGSHTVRSKQTDSALGKPIVQSRRISLHPYAGISLSSTGSRYGGNGIRDFPKTV